jgi:hypothetical protein
LCHKQQTSTAMKHLRIRPGKLVVGATVLFMLQSLVAFSQTKFYLNLYKPGTEVAKLKIESIHTAAPVNITVKNDKGITLYTDKCKSNHYAKLINFANLSAGTYFIDLEQANGVTRKVLVKDDSGLSVKERDYYFHNSIKLKEEDKRLLVRFNSNIDQPVTIRIMDNSGHIIHEETGITSDVYASKFDLSNLIHGNYRVSLISGIYSNTTNFRL